MTVALSEKARIALEKALQQGGAVRLTSKGAKSPGLFPGGASRDIAAAISQCRTDNLLAIHEVEEKKGKTTALAAFAAITREGISALFEDVGQERRKELLGLSAPEARALAEDAFVAVCRAELQATQTELAAVLAKEDELAGQLQAIVENRISTLSTARTRVQRSIQESEALLQKVKSRPKVETPEPVKPEPPKPRDDRDLDFQRDQSEQLVFAWKDAASPEAKELLETVMFNLGLEQLGERGQQLPFDQTTQEIDEVVLRGEPVEVVEPGWRLSNARGVYLINKTKVRKVEAQ